MHTLSTVEPQETTLALRPSQQTCPHCGGRVLFELKYLEGRGYLQEWVCQGKVCDWKRVL